MSADSINIVIPVKNPCGAKARLGEFLTQEQRTELAETLFEEVLRFMVSLPGRPHMLVVTDAMKVADQARAHGADVLLETEARGETAAVEKAAAWSVEHGFASQVVVPGEMAQLDREEFIRLLDHPRSAPSVILCPAVGEDGTNAILTTPPNVLAFRFGDRSFPDYQARAKQTGVDCHILRLPSLVLDLDTPEDLQAFLKNHPQHPAARKVQAWNLPVG